KGDGGESVGVATCEVSLRVIRFQVYRRIEIGEGLFELPFFQIGAPAVVIGNLIRRIDVESLVVFFDGPIKISIRRFLSPLRRQGGRFLQGPLLIAPPTGRGQCQQRQAGDDRHASPAAPYGRLRVFDQYLSLLLQLRPFGVMSLLSLFALDLFAEAPLFFGDAAVDVDGLGFVEVVGAAALPSLRQFQRRAGEQRSAVFVQALPFGDGYVELLPPEQEFTVYLNPSL